MFNVTLMVLSTLAFALAMFAASRLDAQEQGVLDCLGDVANPVFYGNGVHYPTPEQWQAMLTIQGESIWIGYENGGFDIPPDLHRTLFIRGQGEKGDVMVWVFWSPVTPRATYWFVFDNIVPFADANGEHYGVHPCGAYRVEGGQ